MTLALGTKLGPYDIQSPLGAGGMGEVYRARDSRLKRDVALKVLPGDFVRDAQRMARFEREAQLLAALNHPNIAAIYGLEEWSASAMASADAPKSGALVMELVEGPTLAERIAQGLLPLEEALPIAKQIGEALEYAHERSIIHRDLKPTNIKLGPEGAAKVLDFGLAKALSDDAVAADISSSPTLSAAATRAGFILGTAAYMSPEQARGKAVDRRADIWSFGAVLFEMLTGTQAFQGETISDTLAAVIRAEPDWQRLPATAPERIRELLRRCLTKDPRQRLQSIGEARIALEKCLADPSDEAGGVSDPAAAERAETEARRKIRERWLVAALAATATLAAVLGILYASRAPTEAHAIRAYIKPAPNSSFHFTGVGGGFALSSDGRRLAYVATTPEGKALLWVRPIDSLQAQPLAGTEGAAFPFWSPDSRFIGFFADGKLKKIESSGGPPLTLCDAPVPRGGTWNREGVILFTPTVNAPVYRVSASGGDATPLTTLDPSKNETTHRWPYFLPDGRHFLYLGGTPFTPKESPSSAILVGSLDSKESKLLFHAHANAIYASGHILFLRQNTLMAQAFDAKRLELTGEAFPVGDPVLEDTGVVRGVFSASENGSLTFVEGSSGGTRQLIWLDRNGKQIGAVPGTDTYSSPSISPDGKRIAYTLESSGWDVWSYDIARGVKTRLTFGSASAQANLSEVWSPDGRWIAYTCQHNGKFGLCRKPSDGSGSEEVLLEGTDQTRYATDWSPDGKFLTYREPRQGVWAVWMLPLGGERKPFLFLQSQFTQIQASFSPDTKWVAYCSNESGEFKVYVVPFPGPGGKWQVSAGSGCTPRWRRDGKELFYLAYDNKVMAADVKASGPSFEVGTLRTLFETRPSSVLGSYDATADGQRFIINSSGEQPTAAITLVVNWTAELRK